MTHRPHEATLTSDEVVVGLLQLHGLVVELAWTLGGAASPARPQLLHRVLALSPQQHHDG